MAIGRITGPMLFSNLERQGVDLAIDTNLFYAAVTSKFVGIGTSDPTYPLDSPGNARLANLIVLGNTITSNTGRIGLGSVSNVVITGGSANYVLVTDGAGNLSWSNVGSLAISGITGNLIELGANTLGSLSNALVLSTSTTVTNAIAELNQLLGNITDSTGTTLHVQTISGTLTTDAQPNITSVGALSSLTVTGTSYQANIQANVINANIIGNTGTILTGTLSTALQPNITSVGTLSSLTVSSNITAGNISGNLYGNVVGSTVTVSSIFFANGVSIFDATGYGNANVAVYLPHYTGNLYPGNVISTFYGTTHTDVIYPNTASIVTVGVTTAFGLPAGGSADRPGAPTNGLIRFNTDTNTLEVFDGSGWVALSNTISNQNFYGDGVTKTFSLSSSTTSIGILVSVNGTVQQPDVAYSVTGNQITFVEAPLASDYVDIRFLSGSSTALINSTAVDTGNILVTTSNTVIDTFSTATYRAAKYTVSGLSSTDAHMATIMLTHFNNVPILTTFGVLDTGSNTIDYYATMAGSSVQLLAKGTASSNVRVQSTYFSS